MKKNPSSSLYTYIWNQTVCYERNDDTLVGLRLSFNHSTSPIFLKLDTPKSYDKCTPIEMSGTYPPMITTLVSLHSTPVWSYYSTTQAGKMYFCRVQNRKSILKLSMWSMIISSNDILSMLYIILLYFDFIFITAITKPCCDIFNFL